MIMKKLIIGTLGAAVMLFAIPETMAGHHRHHHNDGLHLAAGIVHLVKAVVAPTPPVVVQPAPVVAPAPVVVQQPVVAPAPVVVQPQVVAPAPVVVAPAPVVLQQPVVVQTAPRYYHRPAPPPRHHRPHRGGHRR